MKKPKLNPNYPTVPVVIFGVITGLFLLSFGICNIPHVSEALATGRAYSLGIIFDNTTMIYRSNSPGAYWVMIGLYILGTAAGVGSGIWMLISMIIDYIKKLARQKKARTSHQP